MEQNIRCHAKIVSSLVKVFSGREPLFEPECNLLTTLKNENLSFQVAYTHDGAQGFFAAVRITSPLGGDIRVRQVIAVPSLYPANIIRDENYISTEQGMYPDLLRELSDGLTYFMPGHWQSLWVDLETRPDTPHGVFPIRIDFLDTSTGENLCGAETSVTVYDAELPELPLIRTEWFHGDCLADYYKIPVFSEEHWAAMERFIAAAVKRSVNTILTPQFTPPLDTAVGGERTTIQLVDVTVNGGEYTFDFGKLNRWIDMCLRAGVKYFEMSHLFTQWGAQASPKIMATVDGEYKRIFGWDTPAVGGEYTRFLGAYIPRLASLLKERDIADRVIFHISDEPRGKQLDDYLAAKESVAGLLEGFTIMDALSDYTFYESGAVSRPVVATNHVQPFLDNNVENLWVYYCTSQCRDVSNRFMAMPSARARIYGAQLFKYDIEGALHWGYNFYNSQYSLRHINPYQVTDSGGAFPSGDAFLVYPGEDGVPEESIRMMVLDEAMGDLRAMKYLASFAGKERVMELMEGSLSAPITFAEYPKSDMYLISLRNNINREINRLQQ